jgi:hypothetical protein
MLELILKAQNALDKDDLEAYTRIQEEVRKKYLEEEGK